MHSSSSSLLYSTELQSATGKGYGMMAVAIVLQGRSGNLSEGSLFPYY